ncbi:RloB family protein [Streptosporangium roseum]|nr:RloB family protein [Streptosporangium roseum]
MCEGTVTEVQYFSGIKDHFRALPVEIGTCDIDGCGRDPLGVVRAAEKRRDTAHRKAQRQGDAYLAYDEVRAVVDVDEHTSLEAAIRRARESGIRLAISTPCFEIWLLRHFQECSAALTSAIVQNKIHRYVPGYEKHLPEDFPYGEHGTARRRARTADPHHDSPNRKGRNPSTNAWLTIDAIAASGQRDAKSSRW